MKLHIPSPGTPIEELDTPCLLLDLDALEHNIGVMANYYRNRAAKLRPHIKNHKSPAIAHMQIRAGGTVGGVCAAKVSEAEVMVHAGIPQVLIANQIVAQGKIARLMALAKDADMLVACDDPQNASALSAGATASGSRLGVVVEVDTQMGRCGVRSIEEGVRLAEIIHKLPGITFRGIMSHQNFTPTGEEETRVLEGRRIIQKVLDLRQALEERGLPVEIVSTGETWSYDVAGDMPGVTEIQAGTYVLMDTGYSHMSEFRHAVKVLGTVVSAPRPGAAVGDVGIKAIGTSKGLPSVENIEGITVAALHAEHTMLRLGHGAHLHPGDKFTLIPAQQDILVSRWDQYTAVRRGRVEAVWDISARGCFH